MKAGKTFTEIEIALNTAKAIAANQRLIWVYAPENSLEFRLTDDMNVLQPKDDVYYSVGPESVTEQFCQTSELYLR